MGLLFKSQWQWRSQGLPGWASRPPGRPKWGKWRKFWGKMRETMGKWGNIEEIFLSCPLRSERMATALLSGTSLPKSYLNSPPPPPPPPGWDSTGLLKIKKIDEWKCNFAGQPRIMRRKLLVVFTALIGLKPWILGKLNEWLGNKDDNARQQGLRWNHDVKCKW